MEKGYRAVTLHYVKGDATQPNVGGAKIIVHVCNDSGKWGKGFVLAISKRWPAPEKIYRDAFKATPPPALGDVQFVAVADDITVANIIGQHGVRSPSNKTAPAPIRYEAIRTGLDKLADYAAARQASVHMPRVGCGLAGGTWDAMEPIIVETLSDRGLEVFVYDL